MSALPLHQQNLWLSYFTEKKTARLPFIGNKVEDLLVGMSIPSYTFTYLSLIIYIVALPQDSFAEKDKIYNRRKKQQLEIRINADYDRLLQADERETLQIIAETYLKAIENFLIPRKDFEGKKFYEDVKNLFVKEGILKKIE